MADKNQTPQPDQSGNDSSRRGKKRPDSPNSNRLILALLFSAIIMLVFYPMLAASSRVKEMKFSKFVNGIESGELNPTNVHELVVGKTSIRFQDQPLPEDGETPEVEPTIYRVSAASMGDAERFELTQLLRNKKFDDWDQEDPPSDWQSTAFMLILAAPLVLLLILMIRRVGGAGSALAFGRSRGKLYAQEDLEISFDDVAGINEAVDELKEIVDFLKSPGKYQALGGRIPKGVLLVGAPGTGKTLLAKAVAGEAGVPFVSLSGSDFVEMFVGVGAARVRDMFQQAAQRSPCIIFIDELDALGKARGVGMPGGHDEREQTLNALLVEMDGFGSDQSVIVMAATNRIDVLDPALLRPGRFDRHVVVDRPDIRGREQILKVHIGKVKVDETVDLSRIAKLTVGFVGADLANLVNEAALLAARNDRKAVTMQDFDEGIDRVVAGLEKQSRILDEDEKRRTAYHECGHALVACVLPHTDPVHKISIIPRGMALGYVMPVPEKDRTSRTKTELVNQICCLLGGTAAEQIVYEETSAGAQNDLQRATDIARRMVTEFGMSETIGKVYYSEQRTSVFLGTHSAAETVHSEQTAHQIDQEVKSILDGCYDTVLETLQGRRAVLERMTNELMEVEVMDSDHLKRIMDEEHTGPQIVPGTYAKPTPGTESGEASEESDTSGEVAEGS